MIIGILLCYQNKIKKKKLFKALKSKETARIKELVAQKQKLYKQCGWMQMFVFVYKLCRAHWTILINWSDSTGLSSDGVCLCVFFGILFVLTLLD